MISKTKLLVVEDSDEDFYATKRALLKSGMVNPIDRCIDGQEAIDYLKKEGQYSDRAGDKLPNVILLDLNLPGLNGREFLKLIKLDKEFKKIPVIVLTTSSDENDIDDCYSQGASSYIQKPVDLNKFIASIQRLKDFWFEIVILPDQ